MSFLRLISNQLVVPACERFSIDTISKKLLLRDGGGCWPEIKGLVEGPAPAVQIGIWNVIQACNWFQAIAEVEPVGLGVRHVFRWSHLLWLLEQQSSKPAFNGFPLDTDAAKNIFHLEGKKGTIFVLAVSSYFGDRWLGEIWPAGAKIAHPIGFRIFGYL
jgi:hypothetical protein